MTAAPRDRRIEARGEFATHLHHRQAHFGAVDQA